MVRLTPISLRLRHTETVRHARLVLQSKQDGVRRRRVKWQAVKSLVSFREMVQLMSPDERARCRKECEMIQSFLNRISERGA